MAKSSKPIIYSYTPRTGSTTENSPYADFFFKSFMKMEDPTSQLSGNPKDILVASDELEVTQTFFRKLVGEEHFIINPNVIEYGFPKNNEKAVFYTLSGFDQNKQMIDIAVQSRPLYVIILSKNVVTTKKVVSDIQERVSKICGSDSVQSKSICVMPMDETIDLRGYEDLLKGSEVTLLRTMDDLCKKMSDAGNSSGATQSMQTTDILVLGDCRVGKTTLINKLVNEKLPPKYTQTTMFLNRTTVFKLSNNTDYALKFIDTPGNLKETAGFAAEREKEKIEDATVDETLSSLNVKNLLSVAAIYMVFDLTSYDSYLYALALIKKIKVTAPKIKIITFANKANIANEFKISFDVSEIVKLSNLYYDINFLDMTEGQIYKIKLKTIRYFKVLDSCSRPPHHITAVNGEFNVMFGQKKEKKMIVKMENGHIHYAETQKDLEKKKDKNLISLHTDIKISEVENKKKSKKDADAPNKYFEIVFGEGDPYVMKGKNDDEQLKFKTQLYTNQVMWECVDAVKESIIKYIIVDNCSKMGKMMIKQAEQVTKHSESIYEFERVDKSSIRIDHNALSQMQATAPAGKGGSKSSLKESKREKKEKEKKDKKKK